MSEEIKTSEASKTVVEDPLTPVQPAAQIIAYVEIECRVVLYKGMVCLIHAYDINRQKIKIYKVELTPEEYAGWTEDAEMEALILSKAGLRKAGRIEDALVKA